MSRTVKLGAISAAAVVGTIVLLAVFWTLVNGIGAGPQSAAEAFFASIPSKGAPAAYATTSPAFQRATPVDLFVANAQASQLGAYQSSHWTKTTDAAADKAGVVELSGVINLKGGGAIPAKLGLVKGDGGWSVLSLNLPTGGLSGGQVAASTMGANPNALPTVASAAQQSPDPALTTAPPADAAQAQPPPSAPMLPSPSESPVVVPSGRVASICGRDILRHGRVETLDVHCLGGLRAAPGSSAQCIAVINGERQRVGATLAHYDAVSGQSDVSCRPEG